MRKAVLTRFVFSIILLIVVFVFGGAVCAQSGDSTCYATLDINQDSTALSVSDLVAFIRLLTDSTA